MRNTRNINEGSKFIGTENEFKRYVGGYLRNSVQKTISPKFKKEKGKCEDCTSTEKLEAAHIHGRGRQELMKEVLDEFKRKDGLYEVDLHIFADKFYEKHFIDGGVFRILCKPCHEIYDAPLKKKKS
jgi:hypothetical protein